MNYHRQDYSLFKRGNVWYFWYYDGEVRKKQSTRRKKKYEAISYADEFIMQFRKKKNLFRVYAKDFFSPSSPYMISSGAHLSEAVRRNYTSLLSLHIHPYFKNYYLSEITPRVIETFLSGLTLSSQSKKHILYTLKTIFTEAEKDGLVDRNPAALVRVIVHGQRYNAFTKEEVKKLLAATDDLFYHAMFSLLVSTGLRSGEARALTPSDILHEDHAILVTKSLDRYGSIVPVKGGESRVVYCPQSVLTALCDVAGTKYVFSADGENPIASRTLSQALKRYLAKAEITRRLVIHSFRHTYNTLLDDKVPSDVIRSMTGHKSERMRKHYTHTEMLQEYRRLQDSFALIDDALNLL